MTDLILQLELRLLLLRHGRTAVLQTLSTLQDQSIEDVEKVIAELAERKARKKRKTQEPAELVAQTCRDRPEIADFVTTLINRYENRSFLPQLRDVYYFLERAGSGNARPKSRRIGLARVIAALGKMKTEDLEFLAKATPGSVGNDYALLAREIMEGGVHRRSLIQHGGTPRGENK